MDETRRLIARISRQHAIEHREVTICGSVFHYHAVQESSLASPDHHRETDSPRFQPYWVQLWDSSIALCENLSERELPERSVLDLGCGLGIVGAFAASRGANVLLADAVPEALLLARLNTVPWKQQVRTQCLDWHRDNLPEQFDLIVGGDILYDEADWPALLKFFRRQLAETGIVLLSEPGRGTGRRFVSWVSDSPWNLSETEHSTGRVFALTLPA